MSDILNLANNYEVNGTRYKINLNKKNGGVLTFEATTNSGKTRKITIWANKGDAAKFDNADTVKIEGDRSVRLDSGLLDQTIKFLIGTNFSNLQQGQFSLRPNEKALKSNSLNNVENFVDLQNVVANMFRRSDSRGSSNNSSPTSVTGVPADGGQYTTKPYTETKTKPLSPRAQEYKNKLRELTALVQPTQTKLKSLEGLYSKAVEAAHRQQNSLCNPLDFCYTSGFTSAGNGTPIDMLNKYNAAMAKLGNDLTNLFREIQKLNEEYKDVIDEVNSETTYHPAQTVTPPPIGTGRSETDDDDDDDDDAGRGEEPEEVPLAENKDAAKSQIKELIEANRTRPQIPALREHYDKAMRILGEIDEDSEIEPLALDVINDKIREARELLENAKKGARTRSVSDDNSIQS